MQSSSSGRYSPRINPFNDDNRSSINDDTLDTASEITSIGSDGSDEVSFAELGLTEDYFSHPEGHFGLSTVEELEAAIDNCKSMIQSAKENSDRQKKLVKKLVELRKKFLELKEKPDEYEPRTKEVFGHKLRKRKSKSMKYYCDSCNGLIWGVLQTWYRCRECGFSCHWKCLNSIRRKCVANNSKNLTYILNIAPETGLSWQQFNCIECKNPISIEGVGREEARLCDYTGHYFCPHCHWNDESVSPARVLHGWDYSLQKVSRQSFQILTRLYRKPLLNLEELNPCLFNYVDELRDIRKLREDILLMKEYFVTCNIALDQKMLLKLSHRQHFVDNSKMYSMEDLVLLKEGVLLNEIAKIVAEYARHIKLDCTRCQVKGFYCEICGHGEILFAFDMGASMCSHCKAVFHKDCIMCLLNCPRCERLKIRKERKNSFYIDLEVDDEPINSKQMLTDDASNDVEKESPKSMPTSEYLHEEITSDRVEELKKVSMQPLHSRQARGRLSLPVFGQRQVYSVSSPETPDYKHDWDYAVDKSSQSGIAVQRDDASSSNSKRDFQHKNASKHRFLKGDSEQYENNPLTKRPQRNDADFESLVKVRARSRNKSGKGSAKEKHTKQIDVNDPFRTMKSNGSMFMAEVTRTVEGNKATLDDSNLFESSSSSNRKRVDTGNAGLRYEPRLDPFNTERRHSRKFIDELTEGASSKSGLSKYDTLDPYSIPFSEPDDGFNRQRNFTNESHNNSNGHRNKLPSDEYDDAKNPFL